MPLTWDGAGTRKFELGLDHGVLYIQNSDGTYAAGVPWNGLISVTEKPTGAEPNNLRADNIKYAVLRSAEEMEGTIEAYTFPDEFYACDGFISAAQGRVGGQTRTPFAIGYRTKVGNDTAGMNASYKVTYIYGCTVSPSERAHETIGDDPDAMQMSWDFTSLGITVTGIPNPVSIMTIEGTSIDVQETLPMPTAAS